MNEGRDEIISIQPLLSNKSTKPLLCDYVLSFVSQRNDMNQYFLNCLASSCLKKSFSDTTLHLQIAVGVVNIPILQTSSHLQDIAFVMPWTVVTRLQLDQFI